MTTWWNSSTFRRTISWTGLRPRASIRVIVTHIFLARYHYPIVPGPDGVQMSDVVSECRTKEGLRWYLRSSWEMVAAFPSDAEKLDAVHAPVTGRMTPKYIEPEVYDGHYITYHRMAHDLHHRSTIIGYLNQLGISMDGRRIRPL